MPGYLDRHAGAHAFNLGRGQGFPARQVIEAARAVIGCWIDYEVAPPCG
ncbi:hypothetical protein [Cognatiluteimonas weifangensis]|nr:hypothetical protein [Luteimonas weifangensis]